MKTEDRATCVGCGCSIGMGLAPDAGGHCERCAEAAAFIRSEPVEASPDSEGPTDPLRDGVVDRLRSRYHDARGHVSDDSSNSAEHGNLDWILGAHGEDSRRTQPLDGRTSELVVLWLEDMIRDLDDRVSVVTGGTTAAEEDDSTGVVRDGAARALQTATRDFADEFVNRAPREPER